MDKLLTTIACIAIAISGYFIVQYGKVTIVPQNKVAAANVFSYDVCRPTVTNESLDGQRIAKDTVVVHVYDTITVKTTKHVQVRKPGNATDTVYVPFATPVKVDGVSVNDTTSNRVRKVFTPDEQSTKPAEVILFVDGQKVYSSETVITPIKQIELDGLQEP